MSPPLIQHYRIYSGLFPIAYLEPSPLIMGSLLLLSTIHLFVCLAPGQVYSGFRICKTPTPMRRSFINHSTLPKCSIFNYTLQSVSELLRSTSVFPFLLQCSCHTLAIQVDSFFLVSLMFQKLRFSLLPSCEDLRQL